DIVSGLMAIVWTLGLIILLLAYNMSINGRKKEFAVLRIVGASRKRLAAIVMQEALLTGILGAVTGTMVGMLVILPFSTMIENKLGLPFLLPDIGKTAMFAALSIAAAVISGSFSAAVSAFRISRIDTALILRGDD
ncbi:MAG: FtsX-like permease family protein, partial [Ruminococcus sp.]|nr:FtsX-like permease family protein [Ruminococcus sp.]